MRTTIHHTGIDWRAITSQTAVWIVYILVIWEFLTACVLLVAAVAWWRVVAGHPVRDAAVRLASTGWTMAALLFLGGYLTIAAEWFRMWVNKEVNATSAALQNFLIAGVGLILVHLPEQSAESPCRRTPAHWQAPP